jgi:hypothetical protein
MVAREGNVLKVPGTGAVTEVKGDEILGSYAAFTQKGVTLLAGSGVLEAGTPLTVSGTAKKYKGVAAADVDGTDDPAIIGILRKGVDTTGSDMLANYVTSGIVKTSALKLANGTAMNATQIGNLAAALNGRVDTVHGYLIF